MREQLQAHLEKRVQQCVSNTGSTIHSCQKIEQKKAGLGIRSGEIIKAHAIGTIMAMDEEKEEIRSVKYNVHFKYLIKQKGLFHIEEEIETRTAEFYKGVLVEDKEINPFEKLTVEDNPLNEEEEPLERISYQYDRLKAVQYAERWWNSYNPAYKSFEVDCTNYISQCLHAGEAPMRGYPNRSQGWWMRNNNWSYSWTVANSLRWHLPGSRVGLRAKEVYSPEELLLGDVICYDFQGDGRFDHTTIVTAKDAFGMPLVNAHTTNSRMRYWAYEDSTAYTPNIKYKFFSIVDDE
ncbi:amidase domain-containing protein [Cytobacillus sp.]|uniref:amidase domain-containing protein n=1 Tax=Cytobacillus sp. TaxID=2675269 RepID=UPI0028BEEFE2|nr:amidase domain-containing protein [Cytobacillus sp.]